MKPLSRPLRADPPSPPKRYIFVLMDEFTMLSFASAVECLRIANRMAGRPAYDWRLIGEDGGRVRCSAGAEFTLDGDLDDLGRDDTLVVCSGIDVQAATTKKLLGWLRREARKGIMVGGLCTAAFTLAKAGLLDGKKATIHWENQDSFSEDFEDVTLTKSVFVVDGNRMTTAGGTSSIDLMLKLIAALCSTELGTLPVCKGGVVQSPTEACRPGAALRRCRVP